MIRIYTLLCIYPLFLFFCTPKDTFIYPYYYYYYMEEINEKIYTEARQIRADNTIMLGLKMVENSGLKAEESVRVSTKIGSGNVVIERMKKEEKK